MKQENQNQGYDVKQNNRSLLKVVGFSILGVILVFLVIILLVGGGGRNSSRSESTRESSFFDFDKSQKDKSNEDGNGIQVDENTTVVNSGSGTDTAPSVSTSRDCNGGQNDDYLHPERFINPDGTLKCADGVVIFDHQIAPKFRRTIIPYIEDETGTTIDLKDVDFYITLLETGETVVFEDIFYWYEDGQRTIFNTNKLLWEKWREYIEGNNTYTFGVAMIHRPTGTDISIIFKDHTTMTLLFSGLE